MTSAMGSSDCCCVKKFVKAKFVSRKMVSIPYNFSLREPKMSRTTSMLAIVAFVGLISACSSFEIRKRSLSNPPRSSSSLLEGQAPQEGEKYKNAATKVLSNFMKEEDKTIDPLAGIDFAAPKWSKKLDLETLAKVLDYELYQSEWFVTGRVNPIYFDDSFRFQDPDVTLDGIEAYARGVNKLFDQECSRAEIISVEVSNEKPNTLTCTWRLSGKADIGPGLTIKPYIVYTDFTIDEKSGLILFQEDRFDLPQWDILLSSLFPFLIGKLTAPPAPPVGPRVVEKPVL